MRRCWIDADSCSKTSRRIAIRAAIQKRMPIVLVSNHDLNIRENSYVGLVRVDEGKDKADTHILSAVQAYDVVVTRDVLLAKSLIEKDVFVLNDFGRVFQKETIKARIVESDFHQKIVTKRERSEKKKKNDLSFAFARSLQILLSIKKYR